MKKHKTFFLLFIFSFPVLAQKNEVELTVTKKNEIRISTLVNTGGPHYAIEYERSITPNIGLGLFAKKNYLSVQINDDFELEKFGFGIKSRFYLNPYHVPAFLDGYHKKETLVRVFAEAFVEYVKGERYKTERKRSNNDIYVLTRDVRNFNTASLNVGLGAKYLFYKKIILQLNAGLSKYLPEYRDLNFGGYLTISTGFIF
ncbi:hypothetical protein [Ochrovirga pacifica]|uniref:hypothetical protein n=1 Tax=Ochrovirga pacifica TaxID=1042376 RepID=UPI000255A4DE|nr:hypothetical protein [Ochrovirga pacifica]